MILQALGFVVIALAVWFLSQPSVHPKYPPGGSRKPLPLIGDAFALGSDLFQGFKNLHKKFGPIVGVTLGSFRFVSLSDFDTVKKYMAKDELAGRPENATAKALIGSMSDNDAGGVIFSNGNLWQSNRRFTLHSLRNLGFGKGSMEELIGEEVIEFISHVKKKNGQPAEIRSTFNVAVLNALWQIAASKRMDYDDEQLRKIVNSLYTFFLDSAKPITNLGFQNATLNFIFESMGFYNLSDAFNNMANFCDLTIAQHLAEFKPEDEDKDFVHAYLKDTLSKRPDNKLTDDDYQNLKAILIDLLIGGTDTSNITLTWTMLFLAREQEVQERLFKELSEVTANNSRLATMSDKVNTPYVEAFIMEVQRRANVFPGGAPHRAVQDVDIEGYFVPKDTLVVPFLQEILFNEKDFPNPMSFKPERFIDSNGKFHPNPKVIPFGTGKRKCLGETLAKMTLYRFITGIIQSFKIIKADPNDTLPLDRYQGSPYPNPFHVRFVPRNQ